MKENWDKMCWEKVAVPWKRFVSSWCGTDGEWLICAISANDIRPNFKWFMLISMQKFCRNFHIPTPFSDWWAFTNRLRRKLGVSNRFTTKSEYFDKIYYICISKHFKTKQPISRCSQIQNDAPKALLKYVTHI